MQAFAIPPQVTALLIGGLALIGFLVAVYIVLDKKRRAQRIAWLRDELAKMSPHDPEYNQVRALYLSLAIGAMGAEMDSWGDGGALDSADSFLAASGHNHAGSD